MIRRHLSYANVVSTIALFLVLGGGAYALSKNSVGSRQIKNDSIRSKDIKDRQIRGRDLRDDTITSRQIEEGRFDMSRFVAMNSSQGGACDPSAGAYVSCASTSLNLREPSQVLVVAGGVADTVGNDANGSSGSCRLRVDGAVTPGLSTPVSVGEEVNGDELFKGNGFSITGTTTNALPLREGSHRFDIACMETEPDVRFETHISALALGGTP
jgi:hypothetical protein